MFGPVVHAWLPVWIGEDAYRVAHDLGEPAPTVRDLSPRGVGSSVSQYGVRHRVGADLHAGGVQFTHLCLAHHQVAAAREPRHFGESCGVSLAFGASGLALVALAGGAALGFPRLRRL